MKILTAVFYCGAAMLGLAAPAAAQQTFGGYECTEDCSGHKAGYEWAEENEISDRSDCGGNSSSFIEGCQAYVEDPDRGADEDDDGEWIDD